MLRIAERSIELPRANALSSRAPADIEMKPRSAACYLRRVRRVLPACWRSALQISLILLFAVGIGSNEPFAQTRDLSTQSVGEERPNGLHFGTAV
jgi:peptidoglycan/LPS O-acetylase OafA/YrhL